MSCLQYRPDSEVTNSCERKIGARQKKQIVCAFLDGSRMVRIRCLIACDLTELCFVADGIPSDVQYSELACCGRFSEQIPRPV